MKKVLPQSREELDVLLLLEIFKTKWVHSIAKVKLILINTKNAKKNRNIKSFNVKTEAEKLFAENNSHSKVVTGFPVKSALN